MSSPVINDAVRVPMLVVSFLDGEPITHTGNEVPEQCDHAGGCWSTDLVMLCPWCGVQLFAPPRVLARRTRAQITEMVNLWRAAGWPDLSVRNRRSDERWTIVSHPLFTHVGGLPVRNDKLAALLGD